MNKRTIGIVLVIVIIIAIIAIFGKHSPSQSGPIKIGYVGSLTGDLQPWGEEQRNAVALAVKEINAQGGINGRLVDMIYEDGACNAAKSTSAAHKLINIDGVKIIVAWCSQEALSIAPIAGQNKVIELVSGATAQELTNINDYVFRISPSDKIASKVVADAITGSYSKIAVLTENSAYSISLRDDFLSNVNDNNKIIFNESFDTGTRDFRTLIAKIKAANPDAIFVNANTTLPAALIVKQLRDSQVKVSLYGAYFGSDPEFIKIAGGATEGFTWVEFIADTAQSSVQKFLADYKKEYGQDVQHPQFTALSYDAPYVLKDAIASAGSDPEKLKTYFKNLNEVHSVLGDFRIINGDIDGTIFKLRTIKNGQIVDLSN